MKVIQDEGFDRKVASFITLGMSEFILGQHFVDKIGTKRAKV